MAVVVDDAHWADMDSLRSLLFAARRLRDNGCSSCSASAPRTRSRFRTACAGSPAGAPGPRCVSSRCRRPTSSSWPRPSGCATSPAGPRSGCAPTPRAMRSSSPAMLAELPERHGAPGAAAAGAPGVRHPGAAAIGGHAARPTQGFGGGGGGARQHRTGGCGRRSGRRRRSRRRRWTRHRAVGLLQVRDKFGIREVGFPHPLVQAAVYEQLGPAAAGAAALAPRPSSSRTRVRCCGTGCWPPPHRTRGWPPSSTPSPAARPRSGAWASAAWALVEASSLSSDRGRASSACCARSTRRSAPGTSSRPRPSPAMWRRSAGARWRDATLGYLAILRGRRRRGRGAAAPRVADAPSAIRTPRWPRWWPSGWRCTRSDAYAAARSSSWSRRAVELAAARRPGTGRGRGPARPRPGLAGTHVRGHGGL